VSIPLESIEVGKCYLTESGHIRRVVRLMADGRIQYEHRPAHLLSASAWMPGMQGDRSFAFSAEREVSCDSTPETDEGVG
jgi:hypothetical protein